MSVSCKRDLTCEVVGVFHIFYFLPSICLLPVSLQGLETSWLPFLHLSIITLLCWYLQRPSVWTLFSLWVAFCRCGWACDFINEQVGECMIETFLWNSLNINLCRTANNAFTARLAFNLEDPLGGEGVWGQDSGGGGAVPARGLGMGFSSKCQFFKCLQMAFFPRQAGWVRETFGGLKKKLCTCILVENNKSVAGSPWKTKHLYHWHYEGYVNRRRFPSQSILLISRFFDFHSQQPINKSSGN